MRSNLTHKRRQLERELEAEVHAIDRFVDIGVVLRTVVADPNGEELLEGKPKLRIVDEKKYGGIVDTKANPPKLVGPSRQPQVWYCSPETKPVILHSNSDPAGQVVYGSLGAGKTSALVQWTYFRWLESLGEKREGGITAPTEARLDLVLREIENLFPAHWYRHRVAEGVIEFVDGTQLRLVSTYQQSRAQGTRIAGYNWSFCARDEAQDQVDEHEHIQGRLRAAKHGRAKQLLTCTAKDDPDWRTLRDRLDTAVDKNGNHLWIRRTLYGTNSPFVHPAYWEQQRAQMTARRYAQLIEAKDIGPERQTYFNWSRETNLITVPEIGWEDVTTHELRGSGPNLRVLVGHDPGTLFDVSLLLKAYRRPGEKKPIWVVLDEVTTEQNTTEHHIAQLLAKVNERWPELNRTDQLGRPISDGPQVLVRCDPAGNTDTRTHKSVYTLFANAGVKIKPAAWNATNDGHGKVPLDPGIELVNTLLCAEDGTRRLFVARKPDGSPAAPKLVAAFETDERDLAGKAETQRKNKRDTSHWPAALRYAVWLIEKPRLQILNGGRVS